MFSRFVSPFNRRKKIMWQEHPLEDLYDVAIVGGGVHGLATAYFLARDHGIKRVAVLERRYREMAEAAGTPPLPGPISGARRICPCTGKA
jgi:thioredoxin reductase